MRIIGKSKLNTLLIDTASQIELVALNINGSSSHLLEEVDKSHSVTIFNNIDVLLKESSTTIKNINLMSVGIGPGSFTGIRIAVTTARMFAQLLNIPLVGIKTHLIYALSMDSKINDNLLIALDARKGRVFGALYKRCSNNLEPEEVVAPGDYEIDYLIDRVDKNSKTISAGTGVNKYINNIDEKIHNHTFIKNFQPDGRAAIELINSLYNNKPDKYDNLNNVIPFYARKSDAEIIYEKNKTKRI